MLSMDMVIFIYIQFYNKQRKVRLHFIINFINNIHILLFQGVYSYMRGWGGCLPSQGFGSMVLPRSGSSFGARNPDPILSRKLYRKYFKTIYLKKLKNIGSGSGLKINHGSGSGLSWERTGSDQCQTGSETLPPPLI